MGSKQRRGLLLMSLIVLVVVLGSCLGVDAHQPDVDTEPEPCELTIVSVKAGTEHIPSPERTSPVLTLAMPNATIVWHCGTPDEPPPVIADGARSVRPYAQRAPPRG